VEFRRKYPNLAEELGGKGTVSIAAVRSTVEEAEKAATSMKYGYEPTVVDFIRRCATDEEAKEIIDFMESRGEIDGEYAERLRKQLATQGVRSFGKKKEPGYYYRCGETG
jgi:hypothetical protein